MKRLLFALALLGWYLLLHSMPTVLAVVLAILTIAALFWYSLLSIAGEDQRRKDGPIELSRDFSKTPKLWRFIRDGEEQRIPPVPGNLQKPGPRAKARHGNEAEYLM